MLAAALLALSSCTTVRVGNHVPIRERIPESDGYIPEGTLEERIYDCLAPGPSARKMMVYLPKDYGTSTRRFPVLYLLHGARGHEKSWLEKGGILRTADSLFSAGLAVPCIIVMPNVNQYDSDSDYGDARIKGAMESVFEIDGSLEKAFIDEVVTFVDSNYRTIPSKESRALAGMSIGGLQSRFISANYPDAFGYVGLFSPMFRMVFKPGPDHDFYRRYGRKLDGQFSDGVLGYYYYIGKTDFFRTHVGVRRMLMDRKGYPYEFTLTGGGHSWKNWSFYYEDMLQKIFQ